MAKHQQNGQADYDFDLTFEKKVISITTEDGTKKNYTIREMNGTNRDAFLTKTVDRLKFGPDGKPVGMKSFDGHEADLLIRCMYDENDEQVTKALVQSWPGRLQHKLFKIAEELNALGTEAEAQAKND